MRPLFTKVQIIQVDDIDYFPRKSILVEGFGDTFEDFCYLFEEALKHSKLRDKFSYVTIVDEDGVTYYLDKLDNE